jgi:hypothetical protein
MPPLLLALNRGNNRWAFRMARKPQCRSLPGWDFPSRWKMEETEKESHKSKGHEKGSRPKQHWKRWISAVISQSDGFISVLVLEANRL